MRPLAAGFDLTEFQQYVAAMEKERGFSERSVTEQALLLGEEVGELFKAVRKSENLSTATGSVVGSVDEELADILIFVCAIANRCGINLSDALLRKEALNETRVWVSTGTASCQIGGAARRTGGATAPGATGVRRR
ncbi:MazG nucleotide pyrophosphohydrolase domain-containing protein [Frankia sp. CcWB3]